MRRTLGHVMFGDRAEAGRRLAERLQPYRDRAPIVLGLPRGGVIVDAEVAQRLGAPLDVIVVRKLGVQWQTELAMGAIGEDDVRVLDERVLAQQGLNPNQLEQVEQREREALRQRVRQLRTGRDPVSIKDRDVIIVDDGIATGSTARVACLVATARGAKSVILAVPVAPSGIEPEFAGYADTVVCLMTPIDFFAVGQFYRDFGQTTDEEVREALLASRN